MELSKEVKEILCKALIGDIDEKQLIYELCKSKVEEKDEYDIDWGIPNQLFIFHNNGSYVIVQANGNHDKDNFEANTIFSNMFKIGEFSKRLNKEAFKPLDPTKIEITVKE